MLAGAWGADGAAGGSAVGSATGSAAPSDDGFDAADSRWGGGAAPLGSGGTGNGEAAAPAGGSDGFGGVGEPLLRRVVAEEVDALREDLRSDVLALHRQLVVSLAELSGGGGGGTTVQAQLADARAEVAALRRENARLQTLVDGRRA